jgi:hypothetical protein
MHVMLASGGLHALTGLLKRHELNGTRRIATSSVHLVYRWLLADVSAPDMLITVDLQLGIAPFLKRLTSESQENVDSEHDGVY